jgi:cation transport regulator ChaC
MAYVFGYGTLARGDGIPARLRGYRRAWNVAMDNRETIPGYKYYVDEAGARPGVFVTFLNLVPGDAVDGVVLAVDDFAALDARERNYARVDVTSSLDVDLGGCVQAYVGTDDGRARFETGRRAGDAVVARSYLEQVRAAFGHVEPPPVPVRDLTRIDLPSPALRRERIHRA